MQAPGFEAGGELAAAAAAAAPGLLGCLVEQVAEGAPFSIVALNTLSYLVLSPQVGRGGFVDKSIGTPRLCGCCGACAPRVLAPGTAVREGGAVPPAGLARPPVSC